MMKSALSVWGENLEKEKNVHLMFKASISGKFDKIRLATSESYQLFLNGKMYAMGPARAGKGQFRVDELKIDEKTLPPESTIEILVYSYQLATYSQVVQSPFLCAEILNGGEVIAATGKEGFQIILLENYIKNISEYSLQRGFVESYTTHERIGKRICEKICDKKKFIERKTPYPRYEHLAAEKEIYRGKFKESETKYKPYWYEEEPYCDEFSDVYVLPKEKLAEDMTLELQRLSFDVCSKATNETDYISLEKGEFFISSFPREATGVLSFKILCYEETDLLIVFDEILVDGKISPQRLCCNNAMHYRLKEGTHEIVNFEPYSMKYVGMLLKKGKAGISNLEIIEYKHPIECDALKNKNERLNLIYDAAIETFRQNALDIFMDCPSRERAGWLCDSYFTAKVEKFLTGSNCIERAFLENFLMEDKFDYLPSGMVPMCYPAVHADGKYIPNWAMWFVVELADFLDRTKDTGFVSKFKNKVYEICDFFKKYENSEGLLEKLDSWVFVEWSKANDFTNGINFPSNMMYALMLECVGRLYGDISFYQKAEELREKIILYSYNGTFFKDDNNGSDEDKHITEVCQYYAFFTKTATKERFPKLWEILVNDFGPINERKQEFSYVYPANAFIGNYLRMELLIKDNKKEELLNEIEKGFYYMAKETGTLWEHMSTYASCNHGFASYISVLLKNALEV